MDHFFNFMAENPWQTFFLGPILVIFLSLTVAGIISFLNVILNAIAIMIRGWPPGRNAMSKKSDESNGDFNA